MAPSPASILNAPVEFLPGVGAKRGLFLAKDLQIRTAADLLFHFPYRYFDRTAILPILDLHEGLDFVQVSGTLVNVHEEGESRKHRLHATLFDSTGRLELIWFGTAATYVRKSLEEGKIYIVFGKLAFFNGYPQIAHPELERVSETTATPGLQPLYSSSETLTRMGLSNRTLARPVRALLEKLPPEAVPEVLPQKVLEAHNLCGRFDALRAIHFPANHEALAAATHRLKWEELFASQLAVGKLRVQQGSTAGPRFAHVGHHFNSFYNAHLPFALTGAQKRVVKEIRADCGIGTQMNRLLQGDVGSGKTIVALLSMLLGLDNGYQACLMAPTEILAQQHYAGLKALLEGLGVPMVILTGSVKGATRKSILQGLHSGALPFVVGTHALIEDKVQFQNLGLVVIDEQHRFGVGQRARLWEKAALPPHILVMTATPIPRTLAMTLYGDLDVSVIDELPPGRVPIRTVWRGHNHRPRVMDFIRAEIDKGRQAYVVYPLIEESEKLDFESLMQGYEQVKVFFPEHKYRIAMVHGRQDPAEKARNMERFVKGEAHILVSTTVIEVGVNVPNATVMVVESAERFGLSQLHQLRGRVGRGADQSYCILLTGPKATGRETRIRMETMVETTDGFVIAERDMELRGPGDIHGTRQSGLLKFRLADIVQDAALMEETRDAASLLLSTDPKLEHPENAGLVALLTAERAQTAWGKIS